MPISYLRPLPPPQVADSFAKFSYDRASGTDAGALVPGDWRTRYIDTEIYNDIDGLSVVSNTDLTFTKAGTYYFTARTSMYYTGPTAARIYNVTGATTLATCMNQYVAGADATSAVLTMSGRLVLASDTPTVLNLQIYTTGTHGTTDGGWNIGLSGRVERYSEIVIHKAYTA